jgi:hypothetical protein
MWTSWTAGLDDKEKADFQRSAQGASTFIDRALKLLEQRELELDQEEYNMDTFADASWPYKQAAIVGRRAELRSLKQLLNLRPQGLNNGLTNEQ